MSIEIPLDFIRKLNNALITFSADNSQLSPLVDALEQFMTFPEYVQISFVSNNVEFLPILPSVLPSIQSLLSLQFHPKCILSFFATILLSPNVELRNSLSGVYDQVLSIASSIILMKSITNEDKESYMKSVDILISLCDSQQLISTMASSVHFNKLFVIQPLNYSLQQYSTPLLQIISQTLSNDEYISQLSIIVIQSVNNIINAEINDTNLTETQTFIQVLFQIVLQMNNTRLIEELIHHNIHQLLIEYLLQLEKQSKFKSYNSIGVMIIFFFKEFTRNNIQFITPIFTSFHHLYCHTKHTLFKEKIMDSILNLINNEDYHHKLLDVGIMKTVLFELKNPDEKLRLSINTFIINMLKICNISEEIKLLSEMIVYENFVSDKHMLSFYWKFITKLLLHNYQQMMVEYGFFTQFNQCLLQSSQILNTLSLNDKGTSDKQLKSSMTLFNSFCQILTSLLTNSEVVINAMSSFQHHFLVAFKLIQEHPTLRKHGFPYIIKVSSLMPSEFNLALFQQAFESPFSIPNNLEYVLFLVQLVHETPKSAELFRKFNGFNLLHQWLKEPHQSNEHIIEITIALIQLMHFSTRSNEENTIVCEKMFSGNELFELFQKTIFSKETTQFNAIFLSIASWFVDLTSESQITQLQNSLNVSTSKISTSHSYHTSFEVAFYSNTTRSIQNTKMKHYSIHYLFLVKPLMQLISLLPDEKTTQYLTFFLMLLNDHHNRELLCNYGFLSFLLDTFSNILSNEQHPSHEVLIQLVISIASSNITLQETKHLLNFFKTEPMSCLFLKGLTRIIQTSPSVSCLQFQASYRSCVSFLTHEFNFPTTNFTLTFWFSFTDHQPTTQFPILTFYKENSTHVLSSITLSPSTLILQSNNKSNTLTFQSLRPYTWYQFSIVQQQTTFKNVLSLYINNQLIQTTRFTLHLSTLQYDIVSIGNITDSSSPEQSNGIYRIASLSVFESILNDDTIKSLYILGPHYHCQYQQTNWLYFDTLRIWDKSQIDSVISFASLETFSLKHLRLNSLGAFVKFVLHFGSILDSSPTVCNICTLTNGSIENVQLKRRVVLVDRLYQCGGIPILLSFLLRATTPEQLSESIILLGNVLTTSPLLYRSLRLIHGFHVMNVFLHKNVHLLTKSVIEALMIFCGVNIYNFPEAVISNAQPFKELLLDFTLYKAFGDATIYSYVLSLFASLIHKNAYASLNISVLRSESIVEHLLMLLSDTSFPLISVPAVTDLLQHIFASNLTFEDLQLLGRVLLYFLHKTIEECCDVSQTKLRSLLQLILILLPKIDSSLLQEVFTPTFLLTFISQPIKLDVHSVAFQLFCCLLYLSRSTKVSFASKIRSNGIHLLLQTLPIAVITPRHLMYLYAAMTNVNPRDIPVGTSFTLETTRKFLPQCTTFSLLDFLPVVFEYCRLQLLTFRDGNKTIKEALEVSLLLIDHSLSNSDVISHVTRTPEHMTALLMLFFDNNNYHLDEELVPLMNSIGHIGCHSALLKQTQWLETLFDLLPVNTEQATLFIKDLLYFVFQEVIATATTTPPKTIPYIGNLLQILRMYWNLPVFCDELIGRVGEVGTLVRIAVSENKGKGFGSWGEVYDSLLLRLLLEKNDKDVRYVCGVFIEQKVVGYHQLYAREVFFSAIISELITTIFENNDLRELCHEALKEMLIHRKEIFNKMFIFKRQNASQVNLMKNCMSKLKSPEFITVLVEQKEDVLIALKEHPLAKKVQTMILDVKLEPTLKTSNKKQKIDETLQDNNKLSMKLNDDRMKAFGLIQRKLRSLQGEQDKKVAQNSSVWSDIVGPLFDELGVWSEADSNVENTHNKWKLDQTEGPARMRKRMVRDDLFYQQYNIDPSNCDMVKIQVEKQSPEGNDNEVTNHPPPKLSRIQSFSNKSTKFNVVDNSVNLEEDTIHSLLEDGDQIISAFNCGVLKGIDKENGVFVIGKTHFYIVKGYCMEGNEFVLKGDVSSNTIPIKNIQIVKPRRYMLRSIAVELFSRTGQNELLIFEQHFTEAYKNITKTISSNTHDVLLDIAGIVDTNKRPKLLKLFSSDESAMQQQWVEGKISNFMYLMFLNTQAGRTFNDLTQYPVMPWVLSDYTSTTLDLTNESVYRDLSKPMGAITEERAENVKTRYEMVKDSPETAFHYGSHYSSIGVALYYLVRIEPYAHNAIKMQGTTFDLPDRLFHSIADVWNMLTTRSVTIVYELIPEFFFFPEFLLNLNHYDYGIRDSGVRVEDVVLPPWANGSPQRFVNTQMMALESPYVSSHLHEWIDLIFGYKQRGKAAEDSLNLFHPSSYEGGIDMDDVPAHLRGAYEAMIINFGQTPKQLFKTPHPQRQSTTTITTKTLFSCSDNDVIILTLDSLEVSIGALYYTPQLSIKPINNALVPPNYHINVTWGTVLKLQGKVNATMEDDHIGIITCCSISEDGKILATGGEDCVIAIYSIHRTVEYQKSIVGHSTPLCCICLCRSYSILVSASNDGVVAIWDLNTLNVIRSFIHDRILGVVVHEKLGHILTYSKSKCIVRSINATILNEINNTDEQDSDINISIFGSGLQWYTSYVIITGHVNGDVKLWDCSELICCGDGLCSTHSHKPKLIKNLKKYNKIVTALALTETHDKLAVGYADGEVIEYQLRDETKMNY